ncbi:unnamed protein product [Linum trigynum]|uniref:Uncharacterized protein n=1 Tax=Linum trigynum TaxID=586398 RepID=A0AAV2DVU4_9ROSI
MGWSKGDATRMGTTPMGSSTGDEEGRRSGRRGAATGDADGDGEREAGLMRLGMPTMSTAGSVDCGRSGAALPYLFAKRQRTVN